MPNTNDWYCNECDEIKPPEKVTYEEICADCGNEVVTVADEIGGCIGEIEEHMDAADEAFARLKKFACKHLREGEA